MKLFAAFVGLLLLGVGIGAGLSWYSLQENHGFGALKIGAWTAWPLAGDPNADPYTKAKVAVDGETPLGAAEGIAFHALTDATGKPLLLECQYRLEGRTPPARLWTLTSHTLQDTPIRDESGKVAQVTSRSAVRDASELLVANVGPDVSPGNWLQTAGNGEYQLVMHLYDTPVTGTRGIVEPQMPSITAMRCAR